MKIKFDADELTAKFSIGATRRELYSLVIILTACFVWICRHLL